MSWLIACDQQALALSGRMLGEDRLLARGTLTVELALGAADMRPRRLISYEKSDGWRRRFFMYLNADGSVSVEFRQGASRSYARVSRPVR